MVTKQIFYLRALLLLLIAAANGTRHGSTVYTSTDICRRDIVAEDYHRKSESTSAVSRVSAGITRRIRLMWQGVSLRSSRRIASPLAETGRFSEETSFTGPVYSSKVGDAATGSLGRRLLEKWIEGCSSLIFLSLSWWVTVRAVGQILSSISKSLDSSFGNSTLSATGEVGAPWATGRSTVAELSYSQLLGLHNGVKHASMRNATVLLTSHELDLMSSVLNPQQIQTDFSNLGGMERIKAKALSAVAPIVMPDTSGYWKAGNLFQPARSLLLYGPPGCGKSSLVRAICRSFNLPLLTVQPSSILNCYLGETSKFVRSIYSLARKVQPCVVFVDEMDSLFRARYSQDYPTERNVKTEFMQLWDDLDRSNDRIFLIGATNRPADLDQAILRRFGNSFELNLPDHASRIDIFKKLLAQTHRSSNLDYEQLARRTAGYSPSDIAAICRKALAAPLDAAVLNNIMHKRSTNIADVQLNPVLNMKDLLAAISDTKPTLGLMKRFASSQHGSPSGDAFEGAAGDDAAASDHRAADVRISIPLGEVLGGFIDGFIKSVGPELETLLQEMRSNSPDAVDEEELKSSFKDFVQWLSTKFGLPSDQLSEDVDINAEHQTSFFPGVSSWERREESKEINSEEEVDEEEEDEDDDDDFDDFCSDDFSID